MIVPLIGKTTAARIEEGMRNEFLAAWPRGCFPGVTITTVMSIGIVVMDKQRANMKVVC